MISKPNRVLVVGDIYGHLPALNRCLEAADFNVSKDKLIFLGDYTGNEKHTAHTIDFLLWLKDLSTYSPVFLRGDTDRWLQIYLQNRVINPHWLRTKQGKGALKSYIKNHKYLVDNKHVDFFKELKNYHMEGSKAFMHGGFTTEIITKEQPSILYYNQSMWLECLRNDKEFEITKRGIPKRYRTFIYDDVFIGHQPTTDNYYTARCKEAKENPDVMIGGKITVPMTRRNVHNVNTGIYDGGKLTIMDIKTKEYWQN